MINVDKVKVNDILSYLAILVAFFCATNGELLYTSSTVVYYFPFVVCALALFLELMAKRIITITSYLVWRIVVVVFFAFTMIYTIDFTSSFISLKKYILQSIVVILIGVKSTEDPKNIYAIIKICIFSVLCNLIYAFFTVDIKMLSEGERMGVSTLNESWNANSLGLMSAFGTALVIYIGFICKQKYRKWSIILYSAMILFFVVAAILTGSRKSILIIVSIILYFLLRSSTSYKARNIILAFILVFVVYYSILNISFLYEHIGYRYESLFGTLSNQGGDRSSEIRRKMIEVGINSFYEKPFLGHGINCFQRIYRGGVYAHNNYVELLVDTGIVGVVLYYSYVIKMLFTKRGNTNNMVFIKAMLVSVLIADIGCVSYMDAFCQYVLCIIFYSMLFNKSDLAQ